MNLPAGDRGAPRASNFLTRGLVRGWDHFGLDSFEETLYETAAESCGNLYGGLGALINCLYNKAFHDFEATDSVDSAVSLR